MSVNLRSISMQACSRRFPRPAKLPVIGLLRSHVTRRCASVDQMRLAVLAALLARSYALFCEKLTERRVL